MDTHARRAQCFFNLAPLPTGYSSAVRITSRCAQRSHLGIKSRGGISAQDVSGQSHENEGREEGKDTHAVSVRLMAVGACKGCVRLFLELFGALNLNEYEEKSHNGQNPLENNKNNNNNGPGAP